MDLQQLSVSREAIEDFKEQELGFMCKGIIEYQAIHSTCYKPSIFDDF